MDKTTKWIIGVALVLIVIWVGYVIYKGNEKPAVASVKIGSILPLTGDLAAYAEGIKNAINLAVEQGGHQDKIQMLFEDDHGCLPADSVSAAQKLVNVDKVNGIVGPMCTGSALAIIPVTDPAKIVMIAPSATGKNFSGAGKYAFRVIASDADNSIAVAKWAYNKGYRTAALLVNQSQDSLVSARDDAKKIFTNLGGKILVEEGFITGNRDFRSQLAKIKSANVDVIFSGAMPEEFSTILKQTKDLGIKSVFIGIEAAMGTESFYGPAGAAANGLIFPFTVTPTNKEYTDFITAYKTKYGKEPPPYAAEGYDSAALMIKAIFASPDRTGDSIKSELHKIGNNYQGASGVITFDDKGDVVKPLVIKMIVNGQPVDAK